MSIVGTEIRAEVGKVPVPFHLPALMVCHGMSNVGKSTLVYRMLRHREALFDQHLAHILFCYSEHQPLYEDMAKNVSDISFHRGMPDIDYIKEVKRDLPTDAHILLVLDDIENVMDSSTMLYLSQVGCHHFKVTVLYICHNIFARGRHARSILLQAAYFISMRNLRDQSQLGVLARQVFGNGCSNVIMQAFDWLSKKFERPYTVLDMSPLTRNDYVRLRSCVFPGEHTVLFVIRKKS